MSKYHFQVRDGASLSEAQIVELPDLAAARRVAVQTACAMISQNIDDFWNAREWQMVVSDDSGLIQFSLTLFATDSPATAPSFIEVVPIKT